MPLTCAPGIISGSIRRKSTTLKVSTHGKEPSCGKGTQTLKPSAPKTSNLTNQFSSIFSLFKLKIQNGLEELLRPFSGS
jgi:hypothetical protein